MSEEKNAAAAEMFTDATAWGAEGARVGLVSCKRCGAALLLDPRNEVAVLDLHSKHHAGEDA